MQQVFAAVRKLATTEAAVLILGESGTGKELVARAIHRMGPRAEGPFVTINCGAIRYAFRPAATRTSSASTIGITPGLNWRRAWRWLRMASPTTARSALDACRPAAGRPRGQCSSGHTSRSGPRSSSPTRGRRLRHHRAGRRRLRDRSRLRPSHISLLFRLRRVFGVFISSPRCVKRYFPRWKGTLVTIVFGLNSSAPLMSRARWLWRRRCHHCAGTNSGRTTVTKLSGRASSASAM